MLAHAPALEAKSRTTIGTIIGLGAAGALSNEAAKAMGQKPTRPGTVGARSGAHYRDGKAKRRP